MEYAREMIIKFLIFIFTYVAGNKWRRCPTTPPINCTFPGRDFKDCFCSCLKPSAFDRWIEMNFNSCAKQLRSCGYYHLKFEVKIFEKSNLNDMPIGFGSFSIDHRKHMNDIQVFHLDNRTIEVNLDPYESYTARINPICTICDFCRNLPDLPLPPVILPTPSTRPTVEEPKGSAKIETIILGIVLGICVLVITVAVVLMAKQRKTRRSNDYFQTSSYVEVTEQNNLHQPVKDM